MKSLFKIVFVCFGLVAYSFFLNGAIVDSSTKDLNYSTSEKAESEPQHFGVIEQEISSNTTSAFGISSYKTNNPTSLDNASTAISFSNRIFLDNVKQYVRFWTNTLVQSHYLDYIFPFHHFW